MNWFDQIPNEIMVNILENIYWEDLESVLLISRRFYIIYLTNENRINRKLMVPNRKTVVSMKNVIENYTYSVLQEIYDYSYMLHKMCKPFIDNMMFISHIMIFEYDFGCGLEYNENKYEPENSVSYVNNTNLFDLYDNRLIVHDKYLPNKESTFIVIPDGLKCEIIKEIMEECLSIVSYYNFVLIGYAKIPTGSYHYGYDYEFDQSQHIGDLDQKLFECINTQNVKFDAICMPRKSVDDSYFHLVLKLNIRSNKQQNDLFDSHFIFINKDENEIKYKHKAINFQDIQKEISEY